MSRVGLRAFLCASVLHTLTALDLVAQPGDDVFPMDEDENVTEGAGEMAVKFRGKSGKFVIYNKEKGEGDENRVEFEVDELREVNEAGKEVGTKGNTKHSVKNFRKTKFKFTTTMDVMVGEAVANVVSLEANFADLGSMKVDTFIIKTAGEVGPNMSDPEAPTWDTFAGDVKFNVELRDWKWCGDGATCKDKGKDEIGAYIDLDIVLKGKKEKPGKKEGKRGKGQGRKEEEVDLGANISFDFTDAVTLDGEDSFMPDGYPMQTTKGAKQIFTFRFPKFSDEAVYDPVLTTSESDSNAETPGGGPSPPPPPPPTPSPTPPGDGGDNHAVSQGAGGLVAILTAFSAMMQ